MNIVYNDIMFTEKDKQFFKKLYNENKQEIYEAVIFFKFFNHDKKIY